MVPVVLPESVRPCFFEFESTDVFRRGLFESRFFGEKWSSSAVVSAFKFDMADSGSTTGIARVCGTL